MCVCVCVMFCVCGWVGGWVGGFMSACVRAGARARVCVVLRVHRDVVHLLISGVMVVMVYLGRNGE